MPKNKLILVSQSPRRVELLKRICDFEQKNLNFVEAEWRPAWSPKSYVASIVAEKLKKARAKFPKRKILVADTIVVLDERVMNKPKSHKEACQMLKSLSGRRHKVYTRFALESERKKGGFNCIQKTIESEVSFHRLSSPEINKYIKNFKPFDKAAAYGFQDGANHFVKKLKGSYSNVLGLAVLEVEIALGRLK